MIVWYIFAFGMVLNVVLGLLMLCALSSCSMQHRNEKESPVSGDWRRPIRASSTTVSSRSASRSGSLLVSQKMIDTERRVDAPVLVGVHALQSWLGSSALMVLDLNPEHIAMKFPHIPGSRRVGSDAVEEILKGFRGTVVLVAHDSEQDRLSATWKVLRELRGIETLVLSGGIEAWTRMVEGD